MASSNRPRRNNHSRRHRYNPLQPPDESSPTIRSHSRQRGAEEQGNGASTSGSIPSISRQQREDEHGSSNASTSQPSHKRKRHEEEHNSADMSALQLSPARKRREEQSNRASTSGFEPSDLNQRPEEEQHTGSSSSGSRHSHSRQRREEGQRDGASNSGSRPSLSRQRRGERQNGASNSGSRPSNLRERREEQRNVASNSRPRPSNLSQRREEHRNGARNSGSRPSNLRQRREDQRNGARNSGSRPSNLRQRREDQRNGARNSGSRPSNLRQRREEHSNGSRNSGSRPSNLRQRREEHRNGARNSGSRPFNLRQRHEEQRNGASTSDSQPSHSHQTREEQLNGVTVSESQPPLLNQEREDQAHSRASSVSQSSNPHVEQPIAPGYVLSSDQMSYLHQQHEEQLRDHLRLSRSQPWNPSQERLAQTYASTSFRDPTPSLLRGHVNGEFFSGLRLPISHQEQHHSNILPGPHPSLQEQLHSYNFPGIQLSSQEQFRSYVLSRSEPPTLSQAHLNGSFVCRAQTANVCQEHPILCGSQPVNLLQEQLNAHNLAAYQATSLSQLHRHYLYDYNKSAMPVPNIIRRIPCQACYAYNFSGLRHTHSSQHQGQHQLEIYGHGLPTVYFPSYQFGGRSLSNERHQEEGVENRRLVFPPPNPRPHQGQHQLEIYGHGLQTVYFPSYQFGGRSLSNDRHQEEGVENHRLVSPPPNPSQHQGQHQLEIYGHGLPTVYFPSYQFGGRSLSNERDQEEGLENRRLVSPPPNPSQHQEEDRQNTSGDHQNDTPDARSSEPSGSDVQIPLEDIPTEGLQRIQALIRRLEASLRSQGNRAPDSELFRDPDENHNTTRSLEDSRQSPEPEVEDSNYSSDHSDTSDSADPESTDVEEPGPFDNLSNLSFRALHNMTLITRWLETTLRDRGVDMPESGPSQGQGGDEAPDAMDTPNANDQSAESEDEDSSSTYSIDSDSSGVSVPGLSTHTVNIFTDSFEYNGHSSQSASYNQECSICLVELKGGDIARRLRCKHTFHRDCVDRWFQNNIRCPLCRLDVEGPPLE